MLQVHHFRGPRGEYGARGAVVIEKDASRVYEFIRQVEDQPKWNAGMVKVSEVTRRIDTTTAHVKQVLRWSFMSMHGEFSVESAMIEEPQTRELKTEMLQSSMFSHFSSKLGVHPLSDSHCRLEMSLLMQPRIFVPVGIRHLVSRQVRKQLHGILTSAKVTMDEPSGVVPS